MDATESGDNGLCPDPCPAALVGVNLSYIAAPLRHMAIKIACLRPDPENANKHTLKSIKVIRGSLKTHGCCAPVILDATKPPASLPTIRGGAPAPSSTSRTRTP